jgi:hypothetical protein
MSVKQSIIKILSEQYFPMLSFTFKTQNHWRLSNAQDEPVCQFDVYHAKGFLLDCDSGLFRLPTLDTLVLTTDFLPLKLGTWLCDLSTRDDYSS